MRAVPVFVSFIALLTSLLHIAFSRDHAKTTELSAVQRRIEGLSEELENLRAATRVNSIALQRNASAVRLAEAPPPPDLRTSGNPSVPAGVTNAPLPESKGPEEPNTPERQEQLRSTVLDKVRPPAERIDALRSLRLVRGRGARTEQVAMAAIELAQDQSLPSSTRADALRHLSRLEYPSMKEPLLEIVSKDRDRRTRSEAVELLQPFLGDPKVRDAVAALQTDPDPRVSAEAKKRMLEWENREEK